MYNEITGKYYNPEECVFFKNAAQSAAYAFRGNAEIKAILNSEDNERFIFVFSKRDHARLKKAWDEHTL